MSASPETRQGWDYCACLSDSCNTVSRRLKRGVRIGLPQQVYFNQAVLGTIVPNLPHAPISGRNRLICLVRPLQIDTVHLPYTSVHRKKSGSIGKQNQRGMS
jgi:hypothetical protein